MKLEDMNSKKEAFQDFFDWLYEDNRIENNSVKLHSEIDLSLAHIYSDPNIYYPTHLRIFWNKGDE